MSHHVLVMLFGIVLVRFSYREASAASTAFLLPTCQSSRLETVETNLPAGSHAASITRKSLNPCRRAVFGW
jgi:hypothetical protein